MRTLLAGLGLVVLGLTAACGGGSKGPTTTIAAMLDSCSVLTVEDISAVFGKPLAKRAPDPVEPQACLYNLESNLQVNVVVEHVQGRAYYSAAGAGTGVEGLGDEAKWVQASQLLAVRDGDKYLAVLVISGEDEAARQRKAGALARRALPRLR